ncbi:MAG: hypothetical protein JW791_00250 [Nanoarchaeota archaeon]|nr:hypothetical protein [Nanoarchaeota archaeon]
MASKKVVKKSAGNKKEVKKAKPVKKDLSSSEQKELQEKYVKLFKSVVEIIQKEENVGIVYQVLVDIVTQLENQIRSQMGSNCSSCGHECSECDHE